MSPDDFVARYKTCQRRGKITVALCIIIWIGTGTYAEKVNREGGCDSARCTLSLVGAVCLLGFSLVYTLIHAPKARAEKLGLICPGCGESLASEKGVLGVVAGKCASCGNQISELLSPPSSDSRETVA
jgi:hypothetical protein